MNLGEMASALGLQPVSSGNGGVEITGGYCSDLLSDVMANAAAGNVLVTILAHRNVLAVAQLLGLAAVIITGGKQPDHETISIAREKGIALFTTPFNSFQVCGLIYDYLTARNAMSSSLMKAKEACLLKTS